MTEYSDQLVVIHDLACHYWSADCSQMETYLSKIVVIKRPGGKVSGFLPAFQDKPSVFFKVYFYERGYRFETAGLQSASDMPQVDGVRIPSMVAIMPEHKAILLERRTWEDTSSPWKRLWVNRLGIDWFKVDKWLRDFHDTQVTTDRNDISCTRNTKKLSCISMRSSIFLPLVKLKKKTESTGMPGSTSRKTKLSGFFAQGFWAE